MRLTAIWVALDEHAGYVLENDSGMLAIDRDDGRRVPAFSTIANARLFARDWDASAVVELGEHHNLAQLVAFVVVDGEGDGEPPLEAFDQWIVIEEIAFAAGHETASSPHELEPGLRAGAPDALRQRARTAIAETLRAGREALWFIDEA